ncbi:hypothetical protein XENOCAPTIV_026285, partial [Xenoophorus captivus]
FSPFRLSRTPTSCMFYVCFLIGHKSFCSMGRPQCNATIMMCLHLTRFITIIETFVCLGLQTELFIYIKCVHLLSLSDMTGTGCEYDGVLYRNGQSFKPSCKYQCVCVNGAIGCVSLCSESQPPRVWCLSPRRVKVRGQCCEQWICDEPRRGRKTAPRHAVEVFSTESRSWHKNCITQITSWSPCSKTCGRGLSLRISNANDQCELIQESRLCNLRPCEADITKHIKPGKKCLNIYREDQPSNFTISGCTSKKQYRPKHCGVCTDERCCIPYKSKTVDVEFECPNGTGFTWKMMWIQACFCNLSCRNPNDIFAELESYYGYPEVMN